MLIGLFECSENLSQWRRNPRSDKQSQRRRNYLGENLQRLEPWKQYLSLL